MSIQNDSVGVVRTSAAVEAFEADTQQNSVGVRLSTQEQSMGELP